MDFYAAPKTLFQVKKYLTTESTENTEEIKEKQIQDVKFIKIFEPFLEALNGFNIKIIYLCALRELRG